MPDTNSARYDRQPGPSSTAVLDEIQGRLDAVTPGPWEVCTNGNVYTVPEFDLHRFDIMAEQVASTHLRDEDGVFIAHAPEDMRKVLNVLNTVLTLHACDDREDHCVECSSYVHGKYVAWPCNTVQTVTAALEGKL